MFLKNLKALQKIAQEDDFDLLWDKALEYGMNPPEEMTKTDLYYIITATMADKENFDIFYTNIQKVA